MPEPEGGGGYESAVSCRTVEAVCSCRDAEMRRCGDAVLRRCGEHRCCGEHT